MQAWEGDTGGSGHAGAHEAVMARSLAPSGAGSALTGVGGARNRTFTAFMSARPPFRQPRARPRLRECRVPHAASGNRTGD